MEQTVRVKRLLPNSMAEVVRIRESACSGDCHKCSGCGAAQQTVLLTAKKSHWSPAGGYGSSVFGNEDRAEGGCGAVYGSAGAVPGWVSAGGEPVASGRSAWRCWSAVGPFGRQNLRSSPGKKRH